MDPTVQVAMVGIITTLVTTAGVVIVAFINNRRERGGAAESAMERTLRERITLRDEQIADLREENDEKDRLIMQLTEEIALLREDRL